MRTIAEKKPAASEKPRYSKGRESRAAILLAAARLATTHGLRGLSIGELAGHLGMSKSGLYAHFKSKEELELAAIDTAVEIFTREVLTPALAAPAGLRRLLALTDEYLAHLKRRVFPGGCFFAAVATELDTRPGPALDRVKAMQRQWMGLIEQCIRDGQAAGELDARAHVPQAVFEANAMLVAANFIFVLSGDPAVLEQGRRGLENVLARIARKPLPKAARRD